MGPKWHCLRISSKLVLKRVLEGHTRSVYSVASKLFNIQMNMKECCISGVESSWLSAHSVPIKGLQRVHLHIRGVNSLSTIEPTQPVCTLAVAGALIACPPCGPATRLGQVGGACHDSAGSARISSEAPALP